VTALLLGLADLGAAAAVAVAVGLVDGLDLWR